MKFEEQYEDVLQNIEAGIVQVYHRQATLSDWDVEMALEALIQFFNAEARGKPIELRQLPGIQEEVVRAAKAMCELRLGRGQLLDEHDQPIELSLSPITVPEIVACLKRIRKSVQFWTKSGGRQGYLNYIVEFVR
jgi:hypothetical protein